MGSQCTCQRDRSNSEGYLSSTYKSSNQKKLSSGEPTDLEQEFDNPSRDLFNQNFLHTSITASNHKLQLPPKSKQHLHADADLIANKPTSTTLSKLNYSQISIGNNLVQEGSDEDQDMESEKVLKLKTVIPKRRHTSIDSKVPLIDLQTCEPVEQLQSGSTILRQISGYILSQKNLFEPIKISKENFVRFKKQDIHKGYKFLEKLGEGSYGKVYKVENRQTGEIRAAKVMKRINISTQAHQKLMNEIDILRKLDHPNIIKIYEAYIFQNVYCIITEYCEGGSLLKYLQAGKVFSDQLIRVIFRKLFSALSYIHKLNIVHRDIKLDNIVFVHRAQTSADINTIDIRIIDFGLAKILPAKRVKDKEKTGTYTHMAPEVINGIYSSKNDMWSAGVVLYSVIGGSSPFKKSTKELTYNNILKGQPEFVGSRWRQANFQLKDLIVRLLQKDMNKRITAQLALHHYFLRPSNEGQPSKKIFQKVTKKFIEYHRGSNLLSMIESYISYTTITQKELQQFSEMFHVLDTNSDGALSRRELEVAFEKAGHSFPQSQIDYALNKIGKNHEGRINYSEFVTILSDRTKLHAKKSLIEAFKYIDFNNDGFLQKQEIKLALKSINYKELSSILMELDQNNDNKISLEQFIKYLQQEKIIQMHAQPF